MKKLILISLLMMATSASAVTNTCGRIDETNEKTTELSQLIYFEILNDLEADIQLLPTSSDTRNFASINIPKGKSGFITFQAARKVTNGSVGFDVAIVENPYISYGSPNTAQILLNIDGVDRIRLFDLTSPLIFGNCQLSSEPAIFIFKASELELKTYMSKWVRKN